MFENILFLFAMFGAVVIGAILINAIASFADWVLQLIDKLDE